MQVEQGADPVSRGHLHVGAESRPDDLILALLFQCGVDDFAHVEQPLPFLYESRIEIRIDGRETRQVDRLLTPTGDMAPQLVGRDWKNRREQTREAIADQI